MFYPLKLSVISLLFFVAPLNAQIRLPGIISDHMVLKQKSNVPLWGREKPGTIVVIGTDWDNKKYTAHTASDGEWKIYIKTPSAGGPYTITINGTNSVSLKDILIGEVWLSSGQSNMEWTLRRDKDVKIAYETVDNPNIRLFKVPRQISDIPQKKFGGNASWEICNQNSAANFSAMTYYFAANLYEKLKVPIGIINASWGGTGIEAWISNDVIFSDSILAKPAKRWRNWLKDYKSDSLKYEQEKTAWKQDSIDGIKRSRPKESQSLISINRPHRKHGVLYNGMIAPCVPYALTGILWYQGTSNVSWADEYEYQLNSLIGSWRKVWNADNLYTLIGQLTAYDYASPDNASILRQAQLNQRKLKNTYVFCSIDLGEAKEIHPPAKKHYGERFAFLALNKVYGIKNIPFTSPILKKVKRDGSSLIISFDYGDGLKIKGDKLNDIFISEDGSNFVPAKAYIKNNKLIVYQDEIKQPVAVKYAWNNTVNANLYNSDDLPAFPFNYILNK
ncbi:sialate O-acetylesterase [Dysgonomonas sp.]